MRGHDQAQAHRLPRPRGRSRGEGQGRAPGQARLRGDRGCAARPPRDRGARRGPATEHPPRGRGARARQRRGARRPPRAALTRAVLDPNVLVSAFISQRGGSPDRIVRAWREGAFELVVSPQLIVELTEVLDRPKFALQAGEGRAEAYIAALVGDAIQIHDPPAVSPDSSDDYLIALARAVRADVIVSGDGHLTQLVDPVPTVVTPRQFIEQLA